MRKFGLHGKRLDGFESLTEYIAVRANHEEDKIRERKLDRLYDIVRLVLKREKGKERFRGIIGEIRDEISDR